MPPVHSGRLGAGSVQLSVQLADNDMRPLLYRVQLADDPQQLQQEGALALAPGAPMAPAPAGAPLALLPASNVKDLGMLSSVLDEAGVDPEVEALFFKKGGAVSGRRQGTALTPPGSPSAQAKGGLQLLQLFGASSGGGNGAGLGLGLAQGVPANALGVGVGSEMVPVEGGSQLAPPKPLNCPVLDFKRRALGSVAIRIQSLNSSGALTTACCCVAKVGPHWLRTQDRQPTDVGGLQWQVGGCRGAGRGGGGWRQAMPLPCARLPCHQYRVRTAAAVDQAILAWHCVVCTCS